MKILHVADLHNRDPWLRWVHKNAPRFDLLVIAGDLQDAFASAEMAIQARQLADWLLTLATPTIVCSGNHDYWLADTADTDPALAEAGWIRRLRGQASIVATDGDVIHHHKVRIAVNGWLDSPRIDGRTDILVTHAPPAGTACARSSWGEDAGDLELEVPGARPVPWLLLSGHIHEPESRWSRWGRRSVVLVPGFDPAASAPPHWIIDTTRRNATHSAGVAVKLPPVPSL